MPGTLRRDVSRVVALRSLRARTPGSARPDLRAEMAEDPADLEEIRPIGAALGRDVARPGPVPGPLAETGADRVQNDVSRRLEKVALRGDQRGVKSRTEEGSASAVSAVVPTRMPAVEQHIPAPRFASGAGRGDGSGCPSGSRHGRPSRSAGRCAGASPGRSRGRPCARRSSTPGTARRDVVEPTGALDTWWPRHAAKLAVRVSPECRRPPDNPRRSCVECLARAWHVPGTSRCATGSALRARRAPGARNAKRRGAALAGPLLQSRFSEITRAKRSRTHRSRQHGADPASRRSDAPCRSGTPGASRTGPHRDGPSGRGRAGHQPACDRRGDTSGTAPFVRCSSFSSLPSYRTTRAR